MGEVAASLVLLGLLLFGGVYAVQTIFAIGGVSIWTVAIVIVIGAPILLVTAAAVVVLIRKITDAIKGDTK